MTVTDSTIGYLGYGSVSYGGLSWKVLFILLKALGRAAAQNYQRSTLYPYIVGVARVDLHIMQSDTYAVLQHRQPSGLEAMATVVDVATVFTTRR